MKGNAIRSQVGRMALGMVGALLATEASQAKAPSVDELRSEPAAVTQDVRDLRAELLLIAEEISPIEKQAMLLLYELEQAIGTRAAGPIREELYEVRERWADLTAARSSAEQELERLTGVMADLEAQIARATARSGPTRKAPRNRDRSQSGPGGHSPGSPGLMAEHPPAGKE